LLTSEHVTTQTVVLKTSPIQSGRDLNGKTIGSTSVSDMNSAATLAWIEQTGGDPKSVKVIEVPQSAAAAALGALLERARRVPQGVRRLAQLALELLVLEDRPARRLAVAHAPVRAARRAIRGEQAAAQLLVLEQTL